MLTAPSTSEIEAIYHRNHASKQRPERQRDMLFGAGCGLLCFGLFPFSASAVSADRDAGDAAAAPSSAFQADEFDNRTRMLSLAFSVAGLACVTLSCVVISRAKLRLALAAVLVPLVATIALSCSTIVQYSSTDDIVNVLRHTRVVSYEQELRLERSVNELFCGAHIHELCAAGDVTRAKSDFGLNSWKEMAAACTAMEHEQATLPSGDVAPLSLIAEPTSEALHWCGRYAATPNHEGALDLTQSPYQQHRVEVLDRLIRVLAWRQARVKLLMVLEWFATPALVAVIWWLHSPSPKVQAVPQAVHVIV